MPEHKLKYGIEIIDRLNRLGKLLNYHCEKEYVVDDESTSAVDVAWLYEAEQKYPLFIFEVESKTTNSIAANPLKVFGELNQKFEKPLFLFHLLLKGGQESAKITQLERTYGTYNYRIYRFSLEEELNLIKDILSQHRRLTNALAVSEIIIEILEHWQPIDITSVILHIEELGFEKNSRTLLPAYAVLSRTIPVIREHFIRRLKQKALNQYEFYEFEEYNTYLGSQWAFPVHLGLLSAFANDVEEKYFDKLKKWQEELSYMKQIGPYYGLSRDYDLFMLGMSGAVLSITAILFYKEIDAQEYILKELFEIVKQSERFSMDMSANNCVWLLHLSANLENGKEYFEYVRKIINENEGIPQHLYLNPQINFISVLTGEETFESFGETILVPSWEEFRLMKKQIILDRNTLFALAINYLTDDEGNWNPIIAKQM